MTSERKIHANRANARASTGPQTVAGKARAAGNARRHGLSLPVLCDPALSREVDALARDIAGTHASPKILDRARRIANAQIDLCRVRQTRLALITAALAEPVYETQLTVKEEMKLCRGWLRAYGRLTPFTPDIAKRLYPDPVEGPAKTAFVLSNLAGELAALDRYERRALSRRKFAIRDFDIARQQETASGDPSI